LGLKSFINKLKDFIGFDPPSLDIDEEREHEIAEKIANSVSRWGLESPVWIFTYGISPYSWVLSMVFLLPMAPILEFLGIDIYDYIGFVSKKKNLNELLDRLEKSQRASRSN
jgi:hypothetical protein